MSNKQETSKVTENAKEEQEKAQLLPKKKVFTDNEKVKRGNELRFLERNGEASLLIDLLDEEIESLQLEKLSLSKEKVERFKEICIKIEQVESIKQSLAVVRYDSKRAQERINANKKG